MDCAICFFGRDWHCDGTTMHGRTDEDMLARLLPKPTTSRWREESLVDQNVVTAPAPWESE